MKRTYVYVDGFNLYYGALKNTPYKWLDLKTAFQKVLSTDNQIEKIKYYSARVSDKVSQGASARQHAYIRAIQTIPEVEVYWGSFLYTEKWRPKAPRSEPVEMVNVAVIEEKGSDVNLASHVINDGWKDLYDVAVIVSNDSDLIEPIRIVREELNKTVGIICPFDSLAEKIAKIPPSFVRHLDKKILRESQFFRVLPKTNIKRPLKWD